MAQITGIDPKASGIAYNMNIEITGIEIPAYNTNGVSDPFQPLNLHFEIQGLKSLPTIQMESPTPSQKILEP